MTEKFTYVERALRLVQVAVKAALILGPYDPVDPMMLGVSMVDRRPCETFDKPQNKAFSVDFWNSGGMLFIFLQQRSIHYSKTSSWHAIGPLEKLST